MVDLHAASVRPLRRPYTGVDGTRNTVIVVIVVVSHPRASLPVSSTYQGFLFWISTLPDCSEIMSNYCLITAPKTTSWIMDMFG